MTLQLKGKRVAIEKLKKQQKNQPGSLILPDGEEYLGVIKYVGPEANPELKVGQKAYFTTNYQQFRIAGSDLCVMQDSEVVAVEQE